MYNCRCTCVEWRKAIWTPVLIPLLHGFPLSLELSCSKQGPVALRPPLRMQVHMSLSLAFYCGSGIRTQVLKFLKKVPYSTGISAFERAHACTWLLLSPLPSWQRDSRLLPLHLEVIVAYSLTPPSPPIPASLSFQSSCPCYFKCLLHSGPNPYNNFSKRKDVQKEENETHRTTLNSKAIRNYPLSIWVAINSRSRNYPRRPLRHLLDHSIFLSYQTLHKEKSFLLGKTVYIFIFFF